MSAATDVRRALYHRISNDSGLTSLLGSAAPGYTYGVYYQQAPSAAAFPYVIFAKQAGTPVYSYGGRAYDNDIWLIKGVDRSDTADRVDDIASRLDELLTDNTLQISNRIHLYLRRESDIVYPEVSEGVVYRHSGSLFRLMYE